MLQVAIGLDGQPFGRFDAINPNRFDKQQVIKDMTNLQQITKHNKQLQFILRSAGDEACEDIEAIQPLKNILFIFPLDQLLNFWIRF